MSGLHNKQTALPPRDNNRGIGPAFTRIDLNGTKTSGENAPIDDNQSFQDAPSSPLADELSHNNLSIADAHSEGGDLALSDPSMESTIIYDQSTIINDDE